MSFISLSHILTITSSYHYILASLAESVPVDDGFRKFDDYPEYQSNNTNVGLRLNHYFIRTYWKPNIKIAEILHF